MEGEEGRVRGGAGGGIESDLKFDMRESCGLKTDSFRWIISILLRKLCCSKNSGE